MSLNDFFTSSESKQNLKEKEIFRSILITCDANTKKTLATIFTVMIDVACSNKTIHYKTYALKVLLM